MESKMGLFVCGLLWVVSLSGVEGQGQKELRYTIEEELQVGTLVVDIVTDAELGRRHSHDTLRILRFKFLSLPPCDIWIDEKTGLIRTRGRIDREAICKDAELEPCLVRLDVAVTPMSHFAMIRIMVEILDINDNAPEFHPAYKSHEMLESAAVGSGFLIPAATDQDVGKNGVDHYELLPSRDASHFILNVTTKSDRSTEVKLLLVNQLDRESNELVRLTIVAYDGGLPVKSGSVEIEIIVGDANDNPPMFESNSYEVTILENIPLETTVARVHATDPDIGQNGLVVYSFSAPTQASFGEVFAVNSSSGEVTVIGPVDFESTHVYMLMINARDSGPDQVTADAMVVVHVLDVNDHAPEVVVNTLLASDTDIARVPENVESDSFVAHVSVVDPDSGVNGRFNCSLEHGHFHLRLFYEGEYQVLTRMALDREQQSKYILKITCRDGGQPSLTSSRRLEVEVTDVNDNPPRFLKDEYGVEIMENNDPDSVVIQVTATDEDYGENARIVYRIADDTKRYFSIDHETGVIYTKHSLDREAISQYRIHVHAVDHGLPHSKTGSTVVLVIILDENDMAPEFLTSSFSLSLDENLPAGTEVGVVSARDADQFPSNVFSFSFVPDFGQTDSFSIDPLSGRIITTRPLDREELEQYHFAVMVRDDASPHLMSTASITVYVLDVNDNSPMWLEPEEDNSTTFISRHVRQGSTIMRVRAIDVDVGLNSQIVYALRAEQEHQSHVFHIDQQTGSLILMYDIGKLPENETIYITVTATDRGSQPRSTSRKFAFVMSRHFVEPFRKEHRSPMELLESETMEHSFESLIYVAIVSSATGLVVVILLLIIVCVVRKRNAFEERDCRKYNCRIETLKAMTVKDVGASTLPPPTLNFNLPNKNEIVLLDDCSIESTPDVINYCSTSPVVQSQIVFPPLQSAKNACLLMGNGQGFVTKINLSQDNDSTTSTRRTTLSNASGSPRQVGFCSYVDRTGQESAPEMNFNDVNYTQHNNTAPNTPSLNATNGAISKVRLPPQMHFCEEPNIRQEA